MFIRKMISAITPIFVWLVINVYVLIFSKFLSPLSGLIVDILPSSLPWVLAITLIINAFAQVAIVSLTTIVAIRKYSYENRRFPKWHCRSVVKKYTFFICIYKDINERLII